jgi:hypothetical protein
MILVKTFRTKKYRTQKTPLGSVKSFKNKRYIKTIKGWKLIKAKQSFTNTKPNNREESPWKAHQEYEKTATEEISKRILKLFLEIRSKWLKIEGEFRKAKEDELFRLNGKIYINPKTGTPLTQKQWNEVLRNLDMALVRLFKDAPTVLVNRAMMLGKILQGIEFEQRKTEKLKNIQIPNKMPVDRSWQNAILFAQHNTGELLTNLKATARKNISTILLNGVKNKQTPKQLERDLFDKFTDLNRDWRRIAETEISSNLNNGMLLAELEDKEKDETIFMIGISAPNACKYCKQLIDGKVVVLTDEPVDGGFVKIKGVEYPAIWPGKNNVGRNPDNYWVAPLIHPHDMCSFSRYYPEMESLIPLKKSELSFRGKFIKPINYDHRRIV